MTAVTPQHPTELDLTYGQAQALRRIDRWGDEPHLVLAGAAGTGKTTLVNEFLRHPRQSVGLAATTGKAARRLSEVTGRSARTVHSLLYGRAYEDDKGEVRFGKPRPLHTNADYANVKLVVIDEASMVTRGLFEDLQTWTVHGTRILFVGDWFQLPCIDKGDRPFTIFDEVDGPVLDEVVRTDGAILEAATTLREEGELPASAAWGNSRFDHLLAPSPSRYAIDAYLEDSDDHVLVTWRNKERMYVNRMVRKRLGRKGLLEAGEPLIVCKNGAGFVNGDIITPTKVSPGPWLGSMRSGGVKTLKVEVGSNRFLVPKGGDVPMDGGMPFVPRREWYEVMDEANTYGGLVPCSYGYCLTAHKAQGSQFRRVTVFLSANDLKSPYFNKGTQLPRGRGTAPFAQRWLYTAITRAVEHVTFVTQ